jgi:hypothetical protein
MTSYEYEYETVDAPRRHRSHRHRRDDRYDDDREPRYVETQETYVRTAPAKSPIVPDAPIREREVTRTTELVRRPHREDSDLSIEEVRREFPPPAGAYARDARYGTSVRRSRSVGRGDAQYGAYLDDPRHSHQELDRRSEYYEDTKVERRRSLSRNQKILAAVGGAALAVGGKELWDRRSAEGRPVERNPLASAMVGAAGALAAYEGAELYTKHASKEAKVEKYAVHRGRNGEIQEAYYSEEEEKTPKKKSRRKSIVEGALGLAGLGAAAKGAENRGRRGSRDRDSHRDDRSRSKGPEGAQKLQQAAKAALLAGAAEAFRVRNEPGAWGGEKGKRILTAAIGAGGIDAAIDRDSDKKSKRHILEAVVGGLVSNRVVNGPRKDIEEDPVTGRSRSRSRARSSSRGGGGGGGTGLAALATAGLGALAGKKLLDRSRSRSRGRRDDYERSPSPDRTKRSRSKSVSSMARKGLAALGIGAAANEAGRSRDSYDGGSRRRSGDYSDYEDDDRQRRSRRSRGDVYGDPRYADSRGSVSSRGAARARDGQRNKKIAEGRDGGYSSDSDLGSSTDDEKRIKKMKGKQLLTAGLATVATIHAAHNVYASMEKRDARHKAVQEGEMTPEEARKLRAKATLQDAASIGIAALGIKGAISEIKEANEMRHECKEFREKKEERHRKRLERLQKGSSGGKGRRDDSRSNYSPSYDSRYDDRYDGRRDDRRYDQGPRYYDGNPYASGGLPAPPVGYQR